jgi:trimeric autotransporter adhesin
MANNRIQVKRTNVAGRTANVTNAGNTQYIAAGEFALNMADGILYTSNGSALIEVGANNTNVNITGNATIKAIIANGSIGTSGQVLTSNGSFVYWSTVTSGEGGTIVRQQYTGNGTNTEFTVSGGYTPNNLDVYLNGVKLYNGTEVTVTDGTIFTFAIAPPSGSLIEVVGVSGASPGGGGFTNGSSISVNNFVITGSFTANGATGTSGQVLTSNGTATYWSTVSGGDSVNTAAQYTWTNTHTFSNTIFITAVSSNGSLGTAGHTLHSNGTSTYWAADDQGVTSVATGNGLTGGTITTTGTVSVLANNGIIANSTGLFVHANTGLVVNATGLYVNADYIGTLTANSANFVRANNGITSNASGVFVTQGTGLVVNATGVHVNSSYITSLIPTQSKGITIPLPVNDDEFTLFFTNSSITLSQIRTLVTGTTPSVNATFSYGSSRASGTTIQANILTSNVTAGNSQTSFTNDTIPANSFVWVKLNTVSGTVSEYHATLMYS